MKAIRYYRIEEGTLCIYDAHYADRSISVSLVSPDQMSWYRARFKMMPLSGDVCPREWL